MGARRRGRRALVVPALPLAADLAALLLDDAALAFALSFTLTAGAEHERTGQGERGDGGSGTALRDDAVRVLRDGGWAAEADPEREDVVVVDSGAGEDGRAAAVRVLVEAGIPVVGVGPRRRLEDAFLALIGESS